MKYIIILMFLFISLRCVATSCVSSEMNVISFSNLYKSKFTFDIEKKASGNVIFNVQLPLVIDGHKFKSLYLAGMSGKTKNPVWGLPVAVFPMESNETMLSTEFILPNTFLENAWFSIKYGAEDCTPSMDYEIRELSKT